MPDEVLELRPGAPTDPAADGSLLFIGNATVLLRYGGFTILTDPTFVHRHEKVSIGYGMHATRLTDPALEIGDLPPLDLIVLSHLHGDHFDQVAERELDHTLPILTTPEAAGELADRGFTATVALDTWDSRLVVKGDRRLRVTATPGRHGPGITDLVLPEVMGSVLAFGGAGVDPLRVYVSGDTLVFDELHEIPRRHPGLDVGLFHLGGTKVLGITVTMDAEQGVEAVRIIDARTVVPIHYDDYDVFTSGLDEFLEATAAAGLGDRVRALDRGDVMPLP